MKKLWLIIALVAAATVATAGTANAEHFPGFLYRGYIGVGGMIEFTVSEDGSSVLDFRYTTPPEVCSIEEQLEPGPVAIVNHAFSFVAADFMSFSGTFDSPGTATGTVTPATIVTSCTTLAWIATVGLGGIAELPDAEPAASSGPASSGRGAGMVGIAAALAVGLALAGAAWYARRRAR